MPNLHTRLKNTRRSRGLSQHQLAAMCGVSQPTVAHWERGGHIPRQKALKVLAECLDVDIAWLQSGQDFADTHPAFQHLRIPIQNVPVYEWPKSQEDLKKARPIRYITLCAKSSNIFALVANKNTDTELDKTLVFLRDDKNIGTHLCNIDQRLTLSDNPHDYKTTLGRLIYTIKKH